MESGSNGNVSYSIRDLLGQISDHLEDFNEKLDKLDRRLLVMETQASQRKQSNLLWIPIIANLIASAIFGLKILIG